jgi:hypothetical protein
MKRATNDRPIEPADAVIFLRNAGNYFQRLAANTPEDATFWANVVNAEMCGKCADLIETELANAAVSA